jgi:hypothetical protein
LSRHVRGACFVDYLQMVRVLKDVDWRRVLRIDELAFVQQRIDAKAWYPMASFERLSLAILSQAGSPSVESIRLRGVLSARTLTKAHAKLVAENDPVETLMRVSVFRATMFDFPTFEVPVLNDGQARLEIAYGMSAPAEEATCQQTIGFCEGMLGLAGAKGTRVELGACSWQGATYTEVLLQWDPG